MAEDTPMPSFFRVVDPADAVTYWAVAGDLGGLWTILAGHEVAADMEPGDQVVVTLLDPAEAALVMISDDDDGPRVGPRRQRPLTDYGVGSFFSTEW